MSDLTWYTSDPIFDTVLAAALLFAAITPVATRVMNAPYGRFALRGRANLEPRAGWFLMELPATVVFSAVFLRGSNATAPVPVLLAGLWGIHYINRGFLFPVLLRVPKGARTFGWLTLTSGMAVSSVHGYLHGRFFSELGTHYTVQWLSDPRFIAGTLLYGGGLAINVHADAILRSLRTQDEVARGEKVYRIPRGGVFRWVTNGNYLGELIGWTGFALLTWSLPSAFILGISIANLVPRAINTHRWYMDHFEDYPPDRRVLIPYLF
jgi:3-oxo-5-alpha-steroid 4-dehydrogenase 1